MYFFVNSNNIELAARIELGLKVAIEDGSFDKYFLTHPGSAETLKKSNIKKRKVFYLDNPVLPPKTPVGNKKLWISIE